MRAVLHTTSATEFVVDNTTSGVTVSGTWSTSSYTGGGIVYGADFRYSDGGLGANSVTWPLDGTGGVSSAGKYRLYARWSAATDRPTDAQYTVYHADGNTTVTVNQQQQGGTWVPLGQYDLAPSVSHRDASYTLHPTDATAGRTVADAIRAVPVELETHRVFADAVKLVANDAEDVLYVHADHLGAAQKMTDDGRAVVWDAAFTPFGEVDSILGSATNNQRFPGQYADGESDLSYNHFRDYDPVRIASLRGVLPTLFVFLIVIGGITGGGSHRPGPAASALC